MTSDIFTILSETLISARQTVAVTNKVPGTWAIQPEKYRNWWLSRA